MLFIENCVACKAQLPALRLGRNAFEPVRRPVMGVKKLGVVGLCVVTRWTLATKQ